MRIGIVAGEISGDILGAGLIQALQKRLPQAEFVGIGGPRMISAGCKTLFPMEKLSLMGLVEVLGHLPEVLSIRRQLKQQFLQNPPDIFIGIDAPDFNIPLERSLRAVGIKTAHYVSPTVWAWRQYRIKKIERAVDLVLSIFPFEEEFYKRHRVPVKFVGHPLADHFPLEPDKKSARQALSVDSEARIIALLPGSRTTEVRYLASVFVETARWCLARRPDLQFLVPLPNARTRELFVQALQPYGENLPIRMLDGQSHSAIEASDLILCASGTATLEALLLKRPMVVAYRMAGLTYQIMKRMLKIPRYSMPNLLSGEDLVPEYIQDNATPERLGPALLQLLDNDQARASLEERFLGIHRELRLGANETAANAVLELLSANNT